MNFDIATGGFLLIGFGLMMATSWLGWKNILFHLVPLIYAVIAVAIFDSHGGGKLKFFLVMSAVFYGICWLFWFDHRYNMRRT